jgi:hypothetical protein
VFAFVIPRFMIGTSGEVRTARELGIDNAPPYALFQFMSYAVDDGVDAISGLRRWITKRGWMPVN